MKSHYPHIKKALISLVSSMHRTVEDDAHELLAAMCSHIPNRGEQRVRCYGYYSTTVCRGNRQKEKTDDIIPGIIEPDAASPAKRKAWAQLIQKIYEVDPLTCPQCKGAMKIISFIDQPEVVKNTVLLTLCPSAGGDKPLPYV